MTNHPSCCQARQSTPATAPPAPARSRPNTAPRDGDPDRHEPRAGTTGPPGRDTPPARLSERRDPARTGSTLRALVAATALQDSRRTTLSGLGVLPGLPVARLRLERLSSGLDRR